MPLLALALIPTCAAFLMPVAHRRLGTRAAWLAALVPAAALAMLMARAPRVLGGLPATERTPWAPQLGLELAWTLDGWSLLFALLISGIGVLVVVYSHFYLGAREDRGRFFLALLLFTGAMLGLVLAGNLLLLYIFWELTSVSSFLLIGFWHQSGVARDGALKSLLLTSAGGLAMLAGIALLAVDAGTLDVAALLGRGAELALRPAFSVALALLLCGAFAKSAQVPFHIWLPDAMAAPTPVSAYLHSATMVKAGLYLLGRLWPVAHRAPLWTPLVTGIGLATLVLGAALALRRSDLKTVLALSTVSQLGLITALLGFGTPAGAVAAATHLLNHAAFKGALFLLVGAVDHAAGTRDVRRLSGLRGRMPLTFALMATAALSMAGLPPLGGFVSKEMFFAAVLDPRAGPLAPHLSVLGSAFTVAYSLLLAHRIWFGPTPPDLEHPPHEAGPGLLAPPLLLVAATVALGLFPQPLAGALVGAAAAAITGGAPDARLGLWHGPGWPLWMSAAALGLGVIGYAAQARLRRALERLAPRWHEDAIYQRALAALERGAAALTRGHMTGLLRDYLWMIWAAVLALMGYALARGGMFRPPRLDLAPVEPAEGLLTGAVIAAAALVVVAQRRLVAAVGLGLMGGAISLLWVLMRSPDLALTQIAVEAIGTVMLLLVFPHLPEIGRERGSRPARAVNGLVAAGVGALVFWLALWGNGARLYESIAGFFVERSLVEGGGRNIVNVILVDFRGFDTMGEITVLSIAAVAVYALVRLRPGGERR